MRSRSTSSKTYTIISHIIAVIFAPEDRRLATWIDRLCRANKEAYRPELGPVAAQLQGFIFNGTFYRPSDVTGVITGRKALHMSLWGEMEGLEKDKKLVDADKHFIQQTLYTLLDPVQTDQDIRDALPECLISTLPEIAKLSRTREPAFTIEGNDRALRQYHKHLPKIEVYAAARMIY